MGMPNHLVLVRHGHSEGNKAIEASKTGNLAFHTDDFAATPGHQWRLTDAGRQQAAEIGKWLNREFPGTDENPGFDWFYTSTYVRTRETEAHLGLPGAGWLLNRGLRERDRGDTGSMDRAAYRRDYSRNAEVKELDPLYWRPPGGESIAQVAEDRVKSVLATLHREADGQRVIAVNHGEMMRAFQLQLERWDDQEYVRQNKAGDLHNCQVLHYSRVDPETGEQRKRFSWVRSAWPVLTETGTWAIEETPWTQISRQRLTNAELLAGVAEVPQLF